MKFKGRRLYYEREADVGWCYAVSARLGIEKGLGLIVQRQPPFRRQLRTRKAEMRHFAKPQGVFGQGGRGMVRLSRNVPRKTGHV